jgi:hypothetical protein
MIRILAICAAAVLAFSAPAALSTYHDAASITDTYHDAASITDTYHDAANHP